MFSRDFARSPYIQVPPTVDLALNFHKKISLYCPSLLNIFEGGSLLSFCTVLSLSPPISFIFRRPCKESLFYCYRKWAVDLIFNASRCHWVNKTWWGKNESEKPRKSQSHLLNWFFFRIQRYIQTNIHPNLKLIFSEKAIELQKNYINNTV